MAGDRQQSVKKAGRCPICRSPGSMEYLPFCSKRCADIDLGRWLGGVYAIPGDAPEASETGIDSELSSDLARPDKPVSTT